MNFVLAFVFFPSCPPKNHKYCWKDVWKKSSCLSFTCSIFQCLLGLFLFCYWYCSSKLLGLFLAYWKYMLAFTSCIYRAVLFSRSKQMSQSIRGHLKWFCEATLWSVSLFVVEVQTEEFHSCPHLSLNLVFNCKSLPYF